MSKNNRVGNSRQSFSRYRHESFFPVWVLIFIQIPVGGIELWPTIGGPGNARDVREQLGQDSRRRAPDDIARNLVEVDREGAVGVRARTRYFATPAFFNEGSLGDQVLQGHRENPIDLGFVHDEGGPLGERPHNGPD